MAEFKAFNIEDILSDHSKGLLKQLPAENRDLYGYFLMCLDTPRPSGQEKALRDKIIVNFLLFFSLCCGATHAEPHIFFLPALGFCTSEHLA